MLNSASVMRHEIGPSSPVAIVYQHLTMLQRVLPTTGLHHVREPAVSKVFLQGTLLHEHPAVYLRARIHLQHTEDLAAKIYVTRLLQINASKRFEPFL